MSFGFGRNSKKKLIQAHPDLKLIFKYGIACSSIDFGISCINRTYSEQLEEYVSGRSHLDPRNPKHLLAAKHVVSVDKPLSEAGDIYIWHPDKELQRKLMYDVGSLCHVAGVLQTTAKTLYAAGKTSHILRWGGNWDMDGVVLKDQSFDDLPHFELVKP